MKVLLDECVNGRLARHLVGHDVSTVTRQRWNGVKNGQLLARTVAAGFDAFVTIDRNLSFQNRIASFPVAVVVLGVRSNALKNLLPLVPQLLIILANPIQGTVTLLES